MPVVHEYKNDTGVYLRSAIDGTFVTFQVYDSAERLLEEMGYSDGDDIHWSVVKPLWEEGYVYTGKSGTTKQVETHLANSQLDGLGQEKRAALQEFFETQRRASITVPDDVYPILVDWHNGKYSRDRARDLLYQADDVEACCSSIREFHDSPITVTGVDTDGDPTYDVETGTRDLRCVDLRYNDRDGDLIITLRGQSNYAQGLYVSDGVLDRWAVYSGGETPGHDYQRDLLEYVPAVVELLVDVPDYDLALDRWDFRDASDRSIPGACGDCLQRELEWCAYSIGRPDGESQVVEGTIDLLSPIGYGIVETDEIEWGLLFEVPDDSFSEGQDVEFVFRRENGIVRATDLREPSEVPKDNRDDDTGTKYGSISRRRKQAKRRADEGELEWIEGTITRLEWKQAEGYLDAGDDGTYYFSTTALSTRDLSVSSRVRAVLSDDHERALYLEPVTTGDPTESGREEESIERPLQAGQRRVGWVRYVNRQYGSFHVEDCADTILCDVDRFPVRRDEVSVGMAFSFEVEDVDDGLRATALEREPDRDRSPEEESSNDDAEIESPVDEEATDWITRYASDARRVLDSIDLATDFGRDPSQYESSIGFVKRLDREVAKFDVSEEGNPVYEFPLDSGGHWTLEHDLSSQEPVFEVRVRPEQGPAHVGRVVEGNVVSWLPEVGRGDLSNEARHEFALAQGRFVELVTAFLDS